MRTLKLIELTIMGALLLAILLALSVAKAEETKVITIDFESNPCAENCIEPLEVEPITEGEQNGK